jgi:predicted alpha/beta hydrolase
MRQENRYIAARDGYPLAADIYYPSAEDDKDMVAIMTAAIGATKERYSAYCRFLSHRGWTVIAFDYRGIGGSRTDPVKFFPYTLRDWGSQDLAGVITWAENTLAPKRCVIVGHSMGGQIAAFAPNHNRLDAMLTIGAQKGFWRLWDFGLNRFVLCFLYYLLPVVVRVFGRVPLSLVRCGEDIPPLIALEWGRWGRAHAFVDEDGRSHNWRFASFKGPLLALSFSDDRFFAPRRAVETLVAAYSDAHSVHWHIKPREIGQSCVGHSGFFEERISRRLWDVTTQWLEGHAGPVTELMRAAEAGDVRGVHGCWGATE